MRKMYCRKCDKIRPVRFREKTTSAIIYECVVCGEKISAYIINILVE